MSRTLLGRCKGQRVRWVHGQNHCQEYHYVSGHRKLQVVRNLVERDKHHVPRFRHWVIYDLRNGTRMIPNYSQNYAFITAKEARLRVLDVLFEKVRP